MASATYIWTKILSYMEDKLGEHVISTMFDDVDVVELSGNTLILFTANEFRKPLIEERFISHIQEAMLSIGKQDISVKIFNEKELSDYRSKDKTDKGIDYINPNYTFDSFVVGPSNRFAHAAAEAVAKKPSIVYNPLLIYGPSGLGKTHLLSAIANTIHSDHPDFNIVYIKSEDFTNDLITAVKLGNNADFRTKYRTADLLLMDDIQFIAGKESTQVEFFHTFNTLYEQGKQIVLTSDRPPEEMQKLEDRLKTRLSQGLMADIKAPDYETRCAIIQKKAESVGLKLPDDVISYIAENITSNVRTLEGTVNKILAYRDMSPDFEFSITSVSRAIKDMFIRGEEKIVPTPSLIIDEVSSFYNISESVLRGNKRDKRTAEARQVCMYLIRSMTTLSLEDIAQEFGKDHTTVMHSINKIGSELNQNDSLKNTVNELTVNINGKCSR